MKSSWLSRLTARTKTYPTTAARDAGKAVPIRALPGGDRTFAGVGRTQPALDAAGREAIPFGTTDGGPSYTGDLRPLTIEDVKKLLNKN